MTLTQAQRNKIRYAFEDAGMPEVLAFMAGQIATFDKKWVFSGYPEYAVAYLCFWSDTPQGNDFWAAVSSNLMENLK
jgi:hypothetical protein